MNPLPAAFPEPDYTHFVPKPSPKGGRPSLMSPEVVEEIVRWVRLEGCSDSTAGLLAGISKSTLSRWKQEDEHFAFLLEQARAQFDVARLRNIGNAKNRDGSINWRAQVWLLQQSSPETYGPPSRRRQVSATAEPVQDTASPAAPSPFQVTPEKLQELQARRAQVLARMKAEDDAKAARCPEGAHNRATGAMTSWADQRAPAAAPGVATMHQAHPFPAQA